jgi:antitoxin component of RelBE/YafQ-DinJ toxin-antitoxin module
MNKTQIIKIRVTPEEKAAFDAAVKAGGSDASKVLRGYVQSVANDWQEKKMEDDMKRLTASVV